MNHLLRILKDKYLQNIPSLELKSDTSTHSTVIFVFQWILASILGIYLGVSLSIGLYWTVFNDSVDILGEYIFAVIISSTFGIAQWFVLRRRFNKAGWWVLSYLVGTILWYTSLKLWFISMDSVIFTKSINYTQFELINKIIASYTLGTIIGIIQWIILRKGLSKSVWWLIGSVVSIQISGLIGIYIGEISHKIILMPIFFLLPGMNTELSWMSFYSAVASGYGIVDGIIRGVIMAILLTISYNKLLPNLDKTEKKKEVATDINILYQKAIPTSLGFICPECNKEIIIKYLKPGEIGKCRYCGVHVVVPEK